jgi:hypothetical protein
MRKRLLLAAVIAIAAVTAAVAPGRALAYGHADQPLAQVEISANCDNPSFPLCAPPPNGVGTGGIWLWIEVDADGTAEVRGAACGHTVGGGGAGAGPIHGQSTWSYATAGDLADPANFVTGTDPNGKYYFFPDFGFIVPVTFGHYSTRLAPGVQIQNTVAP